jgi:cell pole-organizing protein PopZ
LGHTGRTLEDIVRDALRPMLQAWLDQHLPRLVERLVQEEIDRLVRAARLR